MKFLVFEIILIFICKIVFVQTQNSIFSLFPQNSNDHQRFLRKPRFSFYNEFMEPLPGVLNDIFPSISANDPIVDTKQGLLRGIIKESRDNRKYFAFLGIPYAVPPLGNLRFEPPQELVGRWEGVRSAERYSSPCFHMDIFFSGRLRGKEDCLYTNVYTPLLESMLPVMIYIHGGGFSAGSGDFYQGKYFMDENVVLVMFNYRLSALGFLNTEDGIVRGNMGLKDQNMLLKWVQENIANFGGDPAKVTLFGESVGAAMTQYHLISQQSQGLFHKAISLSGSVLSPWAFNGHPAASAKRLAQSAGCPTLNPRVMVACLKAVPVQYFKKEYREMMKTIANPAEYFAPSAEIIGTHDTFITKSPREILKEGNYSKIPLMMGVNSMEGLLFTSRIMVNPYVKGNIGKKFSSWIPRYLYYDPKNSTITSILKSFYFPNYNSIDLSNPQDFLNLTNLFSDGCFIHPSHEFAKVYANYSPVYAFYNTYQGRFSVFDILLKVPLPNFDENSIQDIAEISVGTRLFSELLRYRLTNEKLSNYGPSHGDSVFLLFNMKNVPGIGRLSMDYPVSKTFVKALVDFASGRKKDILTYNGIKWPVMTAQSKNKDFTYMSIDLPGQVILEPFSERMEMWDTKLKR